MGKKVNTLQLSLLLYTVMYFPPIWADKKCFFHFSASDTSKSHSQWSPIKRCGPAAIFPRARWCETHHPHCTDRKTEAGGVSGWPEITQSPTHSLLRTHLGRLQNPVPTAAATRRHSAPCTAPAPPFLCLMLNGTFFFHCKSSVLLGTS